MPELLSARERCERWVQENKCPGTDPGEPRIAHWIFKAARTFSRRRLALETARALIESAVQDPSRQREIERELANAYGNVSAGAQFTPSPKTPKLVYDPNKLEALANRIDVDVTAEWLEARSPTES